jgi:hypothetical protein
MPGSDEVSNCTRLQLNFERRTTALIIRLQAFSLERHHGGWTVQHSSVCHTWTAKQQAVAAPDRLLDAQTDMHTCSNAQAYDAARRGRRANIACARVHPLHAEEPGTCACGCIT